MKIIFKLVMMSFIGLLLVGCGSETTTQSDLSVKSRKSTLNAGNKGMSMDLILTNNYASNVQVELKDLVVNVSPCVIERSSLNLSNVSFGTQRNIEITAQLLFKDACLPTNYKLEGTTVLTLDGKSRELPFASSYQELNTTALIEEESTSETNTTALIDPETLIRPILVIPNDLKEIKLNTNSQSVDMVIKVFNGTTPYMKGSVKVELPSSVLSGEDVGLFEAYEVPVNDQGLAIFKYTGPSNLKSLIQQNKLSSLFKFYHIDNANAKEALKVIYSIEEDTYVPVEYSLDITTKDNDFSMGIPNNQKTFTINLKDSDGNNINNSDVKITKIEVTTENALLVNIINTQTGGLETTLALENINQSAFVLTSKKLSGITPIRVTMEFIDNNKQEKRLSTVVNVRVMSGLPSAISISYVGTDIDTSRAKYEEKFAISVTDEYGNKVNTRPYISLGALVGYAVDGNESSPVESNETKRLYYGKSDIVDGIANGIVNPLDDDLAESTNFEDDIRNDVFKYVNNEGTNSDKLVVFGQGKNYEAMGKWDFSKIDDSTLKLEDDYLGTLRSGLSYAIGRNYYQDQCADDGREWLGSTDAQSYQLDEEGTVVVSYKYDYHLTGKDALIWVNLSGYQSDTEKNTRIGEVSKHTLRGRGLESRPTAGYAVSKGTTATLRFDIHHQEVAEWYQNAHFGYAIVANKCANVTVLDSINFHDARSCINGGVAYVEFTVTAPVEADCSFNIQNSVVANEF